MSEMCNCGRFKVGEHPAPHDARYCLLDRQRACQFLCGGVFYGAGALPKVYEHGIDCPTTIGGPNYDATAQP